MRKHLILPSLLAITLLAGGSGLAFACDGTKTTKTASADGKCGSKAGVSTASTEAAGCAGKASAAAAGACGSAAMQTAGAGDHCNGAAMKTAGAGGSCNGAAMKTAGGGCAAQADAFVSSYLCLSGAMNGHCATSSQVAAKTWHEDLQRLIASGKAAEHNAELSILAGYLADWPADAATASTRFAAVSEWTARYCERFPEKAAGAKIVSDPETGRRWVELAAASTDGNS